MLLQGLGPLPVVSFFSDILVCVKSLLYLFFGSSQLLVSFLNLA